MKTFLNWFLAIHTHSVSVRFLWSGQQVYFDSLKISYIPMSVFMCIQLWYCFFSPCCPSPAYVLCPMLFALRGGHIGHETWWLGWSRVIAPDKVGVAHCVNLCCRKSIFRTPSYRYGILVTASQSNTNNYIPCEYNIRNQVQTTHHQSPM